MKETVYLSSAYLAPVEYYTKLYSYKKIFIEQHDHYLKQTYRNRCIIASANGPIVLSIPTEKPCASKCLMKDIRISDHGNWRHHHWNTIESAYNNTPFFEYYQDDFHIFYEKKHPFLFDFNEQLRETICKLIDINAAVSPTDEYKQLLSPNEHDFREIIHPKKRYNSDDLTFTAKSYYQVFESRHAFLPNLSIIDLLFNMGPESLLVLRDSTL